MWSAAGDEEERGNHHKTATVRDRWTRVEYVFPRKHSEFTWAEGGSKIAEHISQGGAHPISKVCCYLLLYVCVLMCCYIQLYICVLIYIAGGRAPDFEGVLLHTCIYHISYYHIY